MFTDKNPDPGRELLISSLQAPRQNEFTRIATRSINPDPGPEPGFEMSPKLGLRIFDNCYCKKL